MVKSLLLTVSILFSLSAIAMNHGDMMHATWAINTDKGTEPLPKLVPKDVHLHYIQISDDYKVAKVAGRVGENPLKSGQEVTLRLKGASADGFVLVGQLYVDDSRWIGGCSGGEKVLVEFELSPVTGSTKVKADGVKLTAEYYETQDECHDRKGPETFNYELEVEGH